MKYNYPPKDTLFILQNLAVKEANFPFTNALSLLKCIDNMLFVVNQGHIL